VDAEDDVQEAATAAARSGILSVACNTSLMDDILLGAMAQHAAPSRRQLATASSRPSITWSACAFSSAAHWHSSRLVRARPATRSSSSTPNEYTTHLPLALGLLTSGQMQKKQRSGRAAERGEHLLRRRPLQRTPTTARRLGFRQQHRIHRLNEKGEEALGAREGKAATWGRWGLLGRAVAA